MSSTSAVVRRPDRFFDGYAFDLDGTLYLGDALLPGAAETVRAVRAAGRPTAFLTNNPLRSGGDYATKLCRLGIPAHEDDVLTATDSLVHYLSTVHPGQPLLALAEGPVCTALVDAGFALTNDPSAARVVIVSFDRSFDYGKLNAAYRAVRLHGAALVATNPDPYCPTPEGGLPDCGAILAAVEACTGAHAEAITGKPSAHMARAALDRLRVPASGAVMVGDRLSTDMVLAEVSGMAGVLVLGGATSPAELASSALQPRYVIESIGQLLPGGSDHSAEDLSQPEEGSP